MYVCMYASPMLLTLLELQSHFGDNPLKFQVLFPQIGTAVLKGFSRTCGSLCASCAAPVVYAGWRYRFVGMVGCTGWLPVTVGCP